MSQQFAVGLAVDVMPGAEATAWHTLSRDLLFEPTWTTQRVINVDSRIAPDFLIVQMFSERPNGGTIEYMTGPCPAAMFSTEVDLPQGIGLGLIRAGKRVGMRVRSLRRRPLLLVRLFRRLVSFVRRRPYRETTQFRASLWAQSVEPMPGPSPEAARIIRQLMRGGNDA